MMASPVFWLHLIVNSVDIFQLVFGIAGIGDEHLDLLSKLCTLLEDQERLEKLKTTDDVNWVLDQLS